MDALRKKQGPGNQGKGTLGGLVEYPRNDIRGGTGLGQACAGVVQQGLAGWDAEERHHQAENGQMTPGRLTIFHGIGMALQRTGIAQGQEVLQAFMAELKALCGFGGVGGVFQEGTVKGGQFTGFTGAGMAPGSGDGGEFQGFHQGPVGCAREGLQQRRVGVAHAVGQGAEGGFRLAHGVSLEGFSANVNFTCRGQNGVAPCRRVLIEFGFTEYRGYLRWIGANCFRVVDSPRGRGELSFTR